MAYKSNSMKSKLKTYYSWSKGWKIGSWSVAQWYSTCLACVRSWAWFLVPYF